MVGRRPKRPCPTLLLGEVPHTFSPSIVYNGSVSRSHSTRNGVARHLVSASTQHQPNLFAGEDFSLDPTPWELAAEADQLAAEVVVNRPLDTVFSYLIPDPLR